MEPQELHFLLPVGVFTDVRANPASTQLVPECWIDDVASFDRLRMRTKEFAITCRGRKKQYLILSLSKDATMLDPDPPHAA
jgi:hypothetical protein